jgi:methylated-DNA-[protein]-cysteine S-methyltransferase
MTATIKTIVIDSPIGPLRLASEEGVLTGLHMHEARHGPVGVEDWDEDSEPFQEVVAQLDAYFAGDLTGFDLPMRLDGTAFQRRVWSGLRDIPYAETWSYGRLAGHVGSPKASRAVGLANGRNPISIIVPCHRVIGANGTLTGYGGGLDRKAWLLEHEAKHAANRT